MLGHGAAAEWDTAVVGLSVPGAASQHAVEIRVRSPRIVGPGAFVGSRPPPAHTPPAEKAPIARTSVIDRVAFMSSSPPGCFGCRTTGIMPLATCHFPTVLSVPFHSRFLLAFCLVSIGVRRMEGNVCERRHRVCTTVGRTQPEEEPHFCVTSPCSRRPASPGPCHSPGTLHQRVHGRQQLHSPG